MFPTKKAASAVALLAVTAIVFTIAAAFGTHAHVFSAVGLWALVIVLLPTALLPRYDLFSPWSFVILSVAIGLTIRGFYIALDYPDPDTIDQLFLLGKPPAFFVLPGIILLAGLLALASGYLWHPLRKIPPRPPRPVQATRLYALVAVILIISLISSALYIALTGGWEAGFISAKRTPIPGLDLAGLDYQSFGVLRTLASLAIFAHLLVWCDLLKPNASGRRWKIPLALFLFVLACAVPFYASIRSAIATHFILSSAVFYYSAKSFPILKFASAATLLMVLLSLMTLLRAERNDISAFAKFNPGEQAFDSLILNRNQVELAKTAHIIDALPDVLDYQYGKTIAIWLAAPIPRSLWPGKPLIQPGPIIGNRIYGQERAGVPPGFIAEMFWNFHLPGVLIGCLLLGMFLRYLHERFRPVAGVPGNPCPQIILYVAAPMMFGFQAISSNIGFALVWLLINWVVVVAILKLITLPSTTAKADS